MIWKLNKRKVGDKRTVKKFAFLPTCVDNMYDLKSEYVIWLSYYEATQVYESYTAFTPDGFVRVIGWHTIRKYALMPNSN